MHKFMFIIMISGLALACGKLKKSKRSDAGSPVGQTGTETVSSAGEGVAASEESSCGSGGCGIASSKGGCGSGGCGLSTGTRTTFACPGGGCSAAEFLDKINQQPSSCGAGGCAQFSSPVYNGDGTPSSSGSAVDDFLNGTSSSQPVADATESQPTGSPADQAGDAQTPDPSVSASPAPASANQAVLIVEDHAEAFSF